MKLGQKLLLYVPISLIGVIGIDYQFHQFFTSPQETIGYYIFKTFVLVTMLLLIKKKTLQKSISYSLLFSGIISLYYRSYEISYGKMFLSRTPAIMGIENLFITIAIWTIVHSLTFLVPYLVAKKWAR